MELNHLNKFNEGFLSIDIELIKKSAFEFHKTTECREFLSKIEKSLLENTSQEISRLSEKYKSVDVAIKKIISKFQSTNESIIGMSILTIFGLHALIKLLIMLKDNQSLTEYISNLFISSADNWKGLKATRNLIISCVFLIYLIVSIVNTTIWGTDIYANKLYNTKLNWKWSGINNYKIKDNFDKVYLFKKTELFGKADNFDIYYNDTLIGRYQNYNIVTLKNKIVLKCIDNWPNQYLPTIKIDLERLLLDKYKLNIKNLSGYKQRELAIRDLEKEAQVKKGVIELRKRELGKLNTKIDSIDKKRYNIYENIDATRKFLLTKGIDYDTMDTPTGNYTIDNIIRIIRTLKEMMIIDNKIGYLSTFVRYAFQSRYGIYSKYNNLKQVIDAQLVNKLRNKDGVLTNVVDFENYSDLERAISDVYKWREVNNFIKKFPPKQKNLIWENGYYKAELKPLAEYLTKTIIDINYSETKKEGFFQKISSIKDKDSLIDVLSAISKTEPWEYNYWLKKLKSTKNTLITWSSAESKQIVCLVFTYPAIKKIAYMTSWCIFTNDQTFYKYLQKGYQFILYDFTYNISEDDDSIIGFTTDLDFNITDCHSRRDRSSEIPRQFTTRGLNGVSWRTQLKNEFIKIDLKEALRKLNPVVIPLFRRKVGDIIMNNKYINNFLKWYE